jgi:hypothetical protein
VVGPVNTDEDPVTEYRQDNINIWYRENAVSTNIRGNSRQVWRLQLAAPTPESDAIGQSPIHLNFLFFKLIQDEA